MANISFKSFTVGVEEEYMVIDPISRELKSNPWDIPIGYNNWWYNSKLFGLTNNIFVNNAK